jgi:hypothetical protein
MPSKEELADHLRKILGTDIEFEKLSKEDLEKLVKIFDNIASILKIAVAGAREKILSKPLGELLQLNEKGGILGLGIIPSIFEKTKEKKG